MIGRIAAVTVFFLGAVGAAHAAPIHAPGPDMESGMLGVTLAGALAWVLNRRRNKA